MDYDSFENRNALKGKIEKLAPFIQEQDSDWICNWEDETQEKFFVCLHHGANKCFVTADRTIQRIGAIYMSEDTAIKVKDKINLSLKLNIKDGNGNNVVKGYKDV